MSLKTECIVTEEVFTGFPPIKILNVEGDSVSAMSDHEHLMEEEQNWEDELDTIGASAGSEALQAMLDRAPNPYSKTAMYLRDTLRSKSPAPWTLVG